MSRRPAPPPGFTLDDDDDDLPPPPPGYRLDHAAFPTVPTVDPVTRSAASYDAPSKKQPPDNLGSPTTALDGDTLGLTSGRNLRVWGIDAPELKQSGWDRRGRPVPIGRNSQSDLTRALQRGGADIGDAVSMSYGRPVAPVSIDGVDLGHSLTRQGSALAAPDYLGADPQRRFEYLQAERLARQNGLGVHDTMFQPPADYRKAPMAAPTRETIAQFWDVPTPEAGMRPEVEQRFGEMVNDRSISPEDVVAYAYSNGGFRVDPEDVRAKRAAADKAGVGIGTNYLPGPKILTDMGDGALGAGTRGLGSGALAGGLDEVGAFVDMAGLTPNRENVWNSDRRLADIWANNQSQNSAILGYDELKHPYAELAGEVAGGLVVPFGAKAKTVPELFRVGAAYGGASGFLGTDGDIGQRAIGGAIGVPIGGVAGAGLGKALEARMRVAPRIGGLLGSQTRSRLAASPDGGPARNVAEDIAPVPPRVPDRLGIGARDPAASDPWAFFPDTPVSTAYPGAVPGKAPSPEEITARVEEWARSHVGDNVMLHGSRKPDIEQFDPYQYSNYGLFGQGTYLTDNAGVALGYAGKGARGADPAGRSIYAVEQSVKNPLDLDAAVDPAKWAKVADQYGLDIQPGMTNEHAYKALEDAIAEDMVPKWEGAEIMSDAVRSLGHDGLTHIGGGRLGKPGSPKHRVMIALDPEQTAIRDRLDVGEMMRPPMRDRDWIDYSEVPPPPSGYTLNQPRTSGNLAMAMDAEPMPSVSRDIPRKRDYLDMGGVRPSRLSDPVTAEQMRRVANDVTPGDVVPIPSNQIGSVEEAAAIEAGRYGPARAPNEREELTRRTVRGWNGSEVPKRGPIDMVGWLRLQGGLRDQQGELSHIGLNNVARKMDFAGQETRFGPLVNNTDGMNLDDAAMRAWEAGYFPDHTDRPSVNEFLDALRSTHEGRARNFLAEDYPEIDRFYGAQGERYALEQRRFESGQPVYADRSVPAGEDKPFPPVQAYEEWPDGGPDFAGNINLGKLQSPQDIGRALSTVGQRFNFDPATRGRIAHAETERLASELNLTPQQLLSRRQGQPFNAEEALAARQILAKSGNEIVNLARRVQALDSPGDEMLAEFQEKLVMHAAIQEQVAGMTAEAGRALQSFRMTADSRAVRGDVLAALVNSGGGKRGLKNAAEAILDATEESPGKFNAVLEKLAKPTWRDKAIELQYIFKLSSPATHVVNAVSNTLTALSQPIEFAAASAIGKVRQAIPGANPDRILASEVGARAFGLMKGAKEGLPQMVRAFRTGEASDFVQRVEKRHDNALPGRWGHHARTPLRALTAADEFFKAIASRMDIDGQAVRIAHGEGLKGDAAAARIAELSANPTDDMLHKSMDYARYLTFQTPLGDFGRGIQQAKQGSVLATTIVPFIRTPTNLLKFSTERSPLAPLIGQWRKDMAAGGARRDVAIAKAAVATSAAVGIYQAAQAGHLTGSQPMDPKKSQFMKADGWQPYSLKIGDQYYSYSRLDPFATTLGVAADMATKADGMTERQSEEYATLLTASIIKSMTDKVYLSGISDLLEAVNDWQRNGPGFLRNYVASNVVPAGVAAVERAVDPEARDAQSVVDAIQSRLPGLSSSMPVKRDIWGEPIVREGGLGPDFASPVYTSTAKNDPVNAEMLAIGATFEDPKRTVPIDGKNVRLSPQQFEGYSELAGRYTRSGVEAQMSQRGWASLSAAERSKLVSDVASTAKKQARSELFGTTPPGKSSGLLGSKTRNARKSAPPPPPGYTAAEGEAGGRNVYGDLQKAIPGVRFTSGFRTPEYQADMRRRGYKPSFNSAHLDGTSLDMLPPSGKSMTWLKEQVRQYDPDARLLVHDGHLHGTFPGYYGAPPLGEARGAKLKNPNAGMPPPPPGYKLDR